MPLTKDQKKSILEGLVNEMKSCKSAVFADFQGLSVKDVKNLRDRLRKENVHFKVAKKTLIKLAVKEAGFGDVPATEVEGPVGVAFCMEDEIAGAKLIYNFGKENKNLKLRGAIFEGRILSVAETKQLAQLPGREELLAQLVYLFMSPIQGFHGVLNNTIAGFVRVLDAIKEQKEKAA